MPSVNDSRSALLESIGSYWCYNCQKFRHFVDECGNPKQKRNDNAEVLNLTEEGGKKESTLLMAISDENVKFSYKTSVKT